MSIMPRFLEDGPYTVSLQEHLPIVRHRNGDPAGSVGYAVLGAVLKSPAGKVAYFPMHPKY